MRVTVLFLLVVLAACSQPRKAAERGCRKANRHMAKAIMLCPDLLRTEARVDTVTVVVAGATDSGQTGYTAADMDSITAICNDLLNTMMVRDVRKSDELEERERTIARMRTELCRLSPVNVADSLIELKIWTQGHALRYWYRVLPRVATAAVTTNVPQVVSQACPPPGVAHWYRTALWWTWGLMVAAMLIFGAVIHRDTRRWRAGLILVLLSTSAMGQEVPLSAYGGWHYPPPPMNMVQAGQMLDESGRIQRDAVYVMMAGVLVGAVLYTQNEPLGLAVGGLSIGYGIRLDLIANKRTRKAGAWLIQGYHGGNTYDVVPDSVEQTVPVRVTPKP